MALEAGTTINQYKVISRLGSGGMGEVYLAQDERLERKVALKLLYTDITQGADAVRRFQQEARTASKLNHPYIITIYEVGQANGSHFISTEYIEGQTLRQYLKHKTITLHEVLDIAIQVATALVTAHEAGIAHRDIKPENIMIRADSYVKVLDFGLAKLTENRMKLVGRCDPHAETESGVNTNPGAIMGTVQYMSPEQARGFPVDARTDIFSLGVVLYEALAGRSPFEAATPSETIIAIVKNRPDPIARYFNDVPAEMERIVGKALAKNKDERYQTMKDMLIDLKRLKRGLEFQAALSDESEQNLSRHLLSRDVSGPARASGEQGKASAQQQKVSTGEVSVSDAKSSAEYIFDGIKQYRKPVFIALAGIALLFAAYYYYRVTRPIDSIAVLPFKLASESGAEDIGDDITEEVISRLNKISPGLRVMPFSEVSRYKGQQVDLQQIGREMNVRAVLTGRITKDGDNIVIRPELVDLRQDRKLLWGEKLSIKFSDLDLASEKIVAYVSQHINPNLNSGDEKKREAQSLYAQGRNAWKKRTAANINEAIGYFKKTLELDPANAPAYAGLADCYNMLATYGVREPKEAFGAAHSFAERALGINNNLAEAHAALAYAHFRGDRNWSKAEAEFKEAIRLDPDYASAHQWYASYLAAMGRFDEALAETTRTQEIDKLSLIIHSHFGLIYFFNRRYDDAIASCRKTVELDPTFFVAHRYMGMAYAQKRMYKEALEEYSIAVQASKGSPLMRAEMASVLALAEDENKARSELNDVLELKKTQYVSAYQIATIYIALKDNKLALSWLEKALEEGADWLVFLKVDPRFDSLRSDPKFIDLQRRAGF